MTPHGAPAPSPRPPAGLPRPAGASARLAARRLGLLGAVVLASLALPDVAGACPSCIVGVDENDVQHLFSGLYLSTALMMSMPFLVVGSVYFGLKRALEADEELMGRAGPAGSPTPAAPESPAADPGA